jgi:hypothetical protein
VKRIIVAALVMVSAAPASSRRVVHIPTLGELCPGGAVWDKIAGCITRQVERGAVKLLRDDDAVKLVHIREGGRLAGLYLYRHAKHWKLIGELRRYEPLELLGFARVTFDKYTGHRIDVGFSSMSAITIHDSHLPALFRSRMTMLCFDDDDDCVHLMTSCDVLVHGKALHSFRGTLVYEERQLRLVGDRTHAGQYCGAIDVVRDD